MALALVLILTQPVKIAEQKQTSYTPTSPQKKKNNEKKFQEAKQDAGGDEKLINLVRVALALVLMEENVMAGMPRMN